MNPFIMLFVFVYTAAAKLESPVLLPCDKSGLRLTMADSVPNTAILLQNGSLKDCKGSCTK